MHELLLHALVPKARQPQLLQILAGLTGMQPTRIYEHHLTFCPVKEPAERQAAVGGTQEVGVHKRKKAQQQQKQEDLYYVDVVREVDEAEFDTAQGGEGGAASGGSGNWRLDFADVPEAGRKNVLARFVNSTDIVGGDVEAYMKANGYKFVSSHLLTGDQFINDNTILLLHSMLLPTNTSAAQTPLTRLPPPKDLRPLDETGTYILQAKIRVQDGAKPEVLEQGARELLQFQNTLKGIVDLKMPERLCMDTRVKPTK